MELMMEWNEGGVELRMEWNEDGMELRVRLGHTECTMNWEYIKSHQSCQFMSNGRSIVTQSQT